MSYEVAKYTQAKAEDWDNARFDGSRREELEIFRRQRCLSEIGKEITEGFYGKGEQV